MNLNSWHNTQLPPEKRAELLLGELTLEEIMVRTERRTFHV